MQELEHLEVRRIRNVRSAAEVGERAVGVRRDYFVGALEVLQTFKLERVIGEKAPRIVQRDLGPDERPFLLDDLVHLLFERLEVFGRERLRDVEVVIEAVLDRGAEPDFRVGAQPAHRGREDVRARVAQHVERARVFLRDDDGFPVLAERRGEILHFAVDRDGDAVTKEALADRTDHLVRWRAEGDGTGRPVGENQRNHSGAGRIAWRGVDHRSVSTSSMGTMRSEKRNQSTSPTTSSAMKTDQMAIWVGRRATRRIGSSWARVARETQS